MKKINNFNIKNLILVFTLVLMATSCSDWIDHDLNTDPDSPADVPMSLLLPSIQQKMGYSLLGNDAVRTDNIWTQHFDGVDRQSYTEARYQITPADVNNLWSSVYTGMMINSSILINKAKTEGAESPNFAGVGQVLMATTLGITTDFFGDIPYSEALSGSQNILKPAYDSQESIYGSIFTLLDEAVVNLNATTNAFQVKGDVCYNGSVAKWKKAAYSIKARHALQLSGKKGNAAYTDALAAVANGFSSKFPLKMQTEILYFSLWNKEPILEWVHIS